MKLFEFDWDAGGYGRGILLVAAKTKEAAIEHALGESKYWHFYSERADIKYVGKAGGPVTVINQYYQE